MTLLFCAHCCDLVNLRRGDWRHCSCGSASGVLGTRNGGDTHPQIVGGRLVHIDAGELVEVLALVVSGNARILLTISDPAIDYQEPVLEAKEIKDPDIELFDVWGEYGL
jgi:hypothetical protein